MHDTAGVVADLARARRRQRAARRTRLDRVSDLYVLVAAVVVGSTAGWPDGLTLGRSADLATIGGHPTAAAAGLLVAAAVTAGWRSGSAGGPLVLSSADLHVAMAPVDHRRAYRGRRWRAFGIVVAAAALCGAVVLLSVSTAPAASTAARGALVGAPAGAVGLAVAVVAHGRVRSRIAGLTLTGIVAWSFVDLIAGWSTSPLTWIGRAVEAPTHGAMAALAVLLVLLAAGVIVHRGHDVDLASVERRQFASAAAGGALALQDVRGLMLAAHARPGEEPRRRPWFAAPAPAARVWWRRGWFGLLRIPGARVARLLGLAIVSGGVLTLRLAQPLLLVVAAGCTYLAALELIEPTGQVIDRPTSVAATPVPLARALLGLVLPSAVAMTGWVLVVATVVAVAGDREPAGHLVAVAVPASLGATAWASYVYVRGRPTMQEMLRFAVDPFGVAVFLHHATPAVLVSAGVLAVPLVLAAVPQAAFGLTVLAAFAVAVAGVAALAWRAWRA